MRRPCFALSERFGCALDGGRLEEGMVTIWKHGQMVATFDAKADGSIVEVPMFFPFE